MIGSDLILGFLAAKLFETKPAAVRPPSAPSAPPPPKPPNGKPPAAAKPPSAQAPAPSSAPSSPAPSTAPEPAAPAFPAEVVVPPPAAPKTFKKAVEVWQVRPELQALKGSPFVVGLVGDVNDATALAALEKNFPSGWKPATKVTEAERNMAVALLGKWQDGNVLFLGPGTIAGRRAFRMTKHPGDAVAPTPQAPGEPVQPQAAAPAPVAPPVAPPAASPALPAAAPPPFVATPPAGNVRQETTVRAKEGLAQVGKRLGRAESQQTATELRAANLPTGPGGVAYTKINLSEGGLRQSKRKTGGLQPGDPLFVPTSWGFIDPSKL